MKRDLQFVRTIDAPYEGVRDRLRDDAPGLLGVGRDPIRATLSAGLRGTAITREVAIEVVGYDEPDTAAAGAHLMFRADDARRPGMFPHLEARLDAIPAAADRTALFLIATYKPPMGMLGGAADAALLHRVAARSLSGLFERIAAAVQAGPGR